MSDSWWDALNARLGDRAPTLEQVGESSAAMGFQSALVGGAVRDLLMGRDVVDLDVVVEGDAQAVAKALVRTHGGTLRLHESFGTATWQTDQGEVDLATARTETYAHPGALPDVEPASLASDFARRDFTVNAMALSLAPDRLGVLLDPHGGQGDLNGGVLRVLHPQSFHDDPTRGWRGCRYQVRYGLSWDPSTADALQAALDAGAMGGVSLQRQGAEWAKVLGEPDVVAVAHEVQARGLFASLHRGFRDDHGLVSRLQAVLTSGKGACFGRLDGFHDALWLALSMGLGPEDAVECAEFAASKQGRSDRWANGGRRVREAAAVIQGSASKSDWGDALKREAGPELLVLHSLGGVSQEAVQWWMDEGRKIRSAVSAMELMDRGVPEGRRVGVALEAAQRCAWEGGSDDAQWASALAAGREE